MQNYVITCSCPYSSCFLIFHSVHQKNYLVCHTLLQRVNHHDPSYGGRCEFVFLRLKCWLPSPFMDIVSPLEIARVILQPIYTNNGNACCNRKINSAKAMIIPRLKYLSETVIGLLASSCLNDK